MGKISNEVLKKIEKENIQPIGRWSFVLKNSFLWSLFGLNIIFGSIGLAISIYLFESSDILNLILSVNDFLQVLILSIPTVWILLTVIFVLVAYLNFKYTERGYKISFPRILLLNIISILILGIFLHNTQASENLNRIFSENISSYNESIDPRYKIWSRPDDGYIAGTILSSDEQKGNSQNNEIQIEDLEKNTWNVDISDAKVRRAVNLDSGEKVKVVGSVVEDSTFKASDVLPWEGKGRGMQGNHQ